MSLQSARRTGRRPFRACVISPLPPPAGGIARWTVIISEHAAGRPDLDVVVLDSAIRWRTIAQLGTLRRLLDGSRQAISLLLRLLRVGSVTRPDVVHLNTSGQWGVLRDSLLLATCRLLRLPSVYHVRFGRVPEIANGRTFEWKAMSVALRIADAVVVLDRRTETAIKALLPRVRAVRIPNCVVTPTSDEAAKSLLGRSRRRVALFVGWVVHAKGVEDLLEAWQKIADPNWVLVVAGPCEPTYLEDLRALAGPSAAVEFVGELDHAVVLGAVGGCDLFVLPSHTEGFPNAILEAMTRGRAILATDVGAIGEMLDGCGVVVPAHDVRRLADAMDDLITDESRRHDLGRRAEAKAHAEYGVDAVVARYLALWRSVGDK